MSIRDTKETNIMDKVFMGVRDNYYNTVDSIERWFININDSIIGDTSFNTDVKTISQIESLLKVSISNRKKLSNIRYIVSGDKSTSTNYMIDINILIDRYDLLIYKMSTIINVVKASKSDDKNKKG